MEWEHIDFVKELVEIAENDLKSSAILYNEELYSQSIYFLQQSVEKISKAYSVLSGDIKPKDIAKKIGHTTPKFLTTQLAITFDRLIEMGDSLRKAVEEKESAEDLIESLENLKEFKSFFLKD